MTHSILDPALSKSALLRRGSIPPQCRDFRLDDFEVVGKPLGCGSFGHVNKVVQKGTGKTFAMKVMSKTKILEFNLEQNIEREVSTQQKMRHPKILQLHKYFEDLEDIYLLLEYAPNGSVFDLLRDRRKTAAASDAVLRGLPEPQAAGMFRDVSEALHFLHCSGVIHRDLKPENVLVCEGGVAKLADFGWCNQLAKGSSGRSTFCGTREYLSPEMIANEPYDCKVDVWAAGVLLFEMLVGRSPFAASNYVQALGKISKAAYEFPDHVSAAARDLVGRLLVREPSRRLDLGTAVGHPWVRGHTSAERGDEPCCGSQQSTRTPRSEPSSSRHGGKDGAPEAAAEVHAMLGRAVAARSTALLENAVQKASAAGLDEAELAEARQALAVEKQRSEARRRLRSATQRRSPNELHLALAEAERLDLSSGLVEHAREVLASLSGAAEDDSDSDGFENCSLEATVPVAPVVRVAPEAEASRVGDSRRLLRSRTEPAVGSWSGAPERPLPAATAHLLHSLRPARPLSPQAGEAPRTARRAKFAEGHRDSEARTNCSDSATASARTSLRSAAPGEGDGPGRRAKFAEGCRDSEARTNCSDSATASARTSLRSAAPCNGEGLLASLLSPRRTRGSASILGCSDFGFVMEPARADPLDCSAPARTFAPAFGSVGGLPASASFTPRSEEHWSISSCDRTSSKEGSSRAGVGLRERLSVRKTQLKISRSLASTVSSVCTDDPLGDPLAATCPAGLLLHAGSLGALEELAGPTEYSPGKDWSAPSPRGIPLPGRGIALPGGSGSLAEEDQDRSPVNVLDCSVPSAILHRI